MAEKKLNSHQLKRFVRHLCLVTKHYYDRENARRNVQEHLIKLKQSPALDQEISLLNRKINLLLEKETRVAELGLRKKRIPEPVAQKIKLLEDQLSLLITERNKLAAENEQLKSNLTEISSASRLKPVPTEKIKGIEAIAEMNHRQTLINELQAKISFLELSYRKISQDNTIDPQRLKLIEDKLKSYKEELFRIKKIISL